MIAFPRPRDDETSVALRGEVRAFLTEALASRTPLERADSWNGFDRGFSRAVGKRGWLGMTWPVEYGGAERTAGERYVVMEEMLAAGAPVSAHWIAERQSGPTLLKYGTERQKASILPRIAAGKLCFCIGMSEPEAGSDLAAVRTSAAAVEGGWRINGTKSWTTNAHRADYMLLLCRTSGSPGDRHRGLSQLLVDLGASDGITISPVIDSAGQHHFNEVHFDGSFVPSDCLVGTEGHGWAQVMSELALERSGPERFLSSFQLIVEWLRVAGDGAHVDAAIARLTSRLMVLRHLSRGVSTLLDRGEDPAVQAAIVKDLGAAFEQEVPEIVRELVAVEADLNSTSGLSAVLARTLLNVPSFSLRGGTREILRGVVAKALQER